MGLCRSPRHRVLFGSSSLVDRWQRCQDGFALLPVLVVQGAADEMDDAGLRRRLPQCRADRASRAFQPVDHGDEDVIVTAAAKLVEDL